MNTFELKYYKLGNLNQVKNEGEKHVKVLPYLSVVQVTEGSYEIGLGNGKFELISEGGFFIAPSWVTQTIIHHVSEKTGTMSARWLFVDVVMNKQHKLDSLYEMPLVIENETKHRLNQIFDELFNARTTLKEYACCYNVLDLVLSLSTYSPHKCSQGISLAVSYMMEHYNLALSIKELSKIANTSEPNFYATFKKHYGVSPISYLNHYRLSLAESMLLDGNDSISEIAYQVGITDPLYFSRLFKKTFGLSPKEYKKTYNENKE